MKEQPDGINLRRQRKRNRTMNIGTWNVKGLNTKEKELLDELKRYQMDIVAVTETKKKGNGSEQLKDYVHLYSGVDKACRARAGVSLFISKKLAKDIKDWQPINERFIRADIKIKGYDMSIIAVYAPSNDETIAIKDDHDNTLHEILDNIGNKKEIILLGDFNAHVGAKRNDIIVGPHGDPDINDNGERLTDLCLHHSLQIKNGYFNHKNIHKYTWEQPTLQRKSIIDLIIVKQNTRLKYMDVKVHRGAECRTDHYLVRAKILFPWNSQTLENNDDGTTQQIESTLYNTDSLKNESTVFLYQLRLSSKLSDVMYSDGVTMYHNIVKSVEEAATEALGKRTTAKRNNKNEWWSEITETLVNEKKEPTKNGLIQRTMMTERTIHDAVER